MTRRKINIVDITPDQCEKCIHGYVCHMGVSLNPLLFHKTEGVKCMVFLDKEEVFEWRRTYDSLHRTKKGDE